MQPLALLFRGLVVALGVGRGGNLLGGPIVRGALRRRNLAREGCAGSSPARRPCPWPAPRLPVLPLPPPPAGAASAVGVASAAGLALPHRQLRHTLHGRLLEPLPDSATGAAPPPPAGFPAGLWERGQGRSRGRGFLCILSLHRPVLCSHLTPQLQDPPLPWTPLPPPHPLPPPLPPPLPLQQPLPCGLEPGQTSSDAGVSFFVCLGSR